MRESILITRNLISISGVIKRRPERAVMGVTHGFDAIDATTFDDVLGQYPDSVPEKLSDLDAQRYESIPDIVAARRPAPFLTKEEVATLVDWKLSHGKFRPTLKGLVQQNTDQVVQDITTEGFRTYSVSGESVKASLNTLTKLRGIGPATASLLLSVHNPQTAPFFSDELFRWCFFESGKGKGWDRDIKYTLKEYTQLWEKFGELRQRFTDSYDRNISAIEIEKVAYVLGKQAIGTASSEPLKNTNSGVKRKATNTEHSSGIKQAKVDNASKHNTRHTRSNDRSMSDGTEKRLTRSKKSE